MKTVHVHLLPDKGKRLMQKTNVLEVKLNEIRKRKMQSEFYYLLQCFHLILLIL